MAKLIGYIKDNSINIYIKNRLLGTIDITNIKSIPNIPKVFNLTKEHLKKEWDKIKHNLTITDRLLNYIFNSELKLFIESDFSTSEGFGLMNIFIDVLKISKIELLHKSDYFFTNGNKNNFCFVESNTRNFIYLDFNTGNKIIISKDNIDHLKQYINLERVDIISDKYITELKEFEQITLKDYQIIEHYLNK